MDEGKSSQHVRGFIISLTGGSFCNFNERWNPQKLEETLLLLLLGIDSKYVRALHVGKKNSNSPVNNP
jgi:hypothetical protein